MFLVWEESINHILLHCGKSEVYIFFFPWLRYLGFCHPWWGVCYQIGMGPLYARREYKSYFLILLAVGILYILGLLYFGVFFLIFTTFSFLHTKKKKGTIPITIFIENFLPLIFYSWNFIFLSCLWFYGAWTPPQKNTSRSPPAQ